ncbi:26042_t:CDS:2, partial [Gigaspora rosea]
MASGEELCYKGWQHQFGIDVEKDFGKAFEYYKQAADLDNGEGLFWTGFCYNWGIEEDKDKHKEWFNKDSLKQVRFYAERD